MALLSFEGVGKRYRRGRSEVVVLDEVWWTVDPGDWIGVWGERRTGKSTLLELAAGIELADSGVVRLDGNDLAGQSRLARARLLRTDVGLACAPTHDLWEATRRKRVVEHVALPLQASGWVGTEAAAAARRMLARVGAAHCAELRTYELSLGERTRVGLARALIREPRLLLVDEPAATPSPGEQDEIHELLFSLARETGLTMIVASEEPAMLRGATRIVSLDNGQLLTTDEPGTVVPFPNAGRRESPAS